MLLGVILACQQSARADEAIVVAYAGIWHVTDEEIVQEGAAGLYDVIEFRALASVGCGGDVTYSWDFDDGHSGDGAVAMHYYQDGEEGEKTVTLTISADGVYDVIRTFTLYIVKRVEITKIGGIVIGNEGVLGRRMSFDNACQVEGHVVPAILRPVLDPLLDWKFSDTMLGNITGEGPDPQLPLPAQQWPAESHNGAGVRYWGRENGGASLDCQLNMPLVGTVRVDTKIGIAKYFDPAGMQNGQKNPAWSVEAPNKARPNWFQYWTTDQKVRDEFWGEPGGIGKEAILYADKVIVRAANTYEDVMNNKNKEVSLGGFCGWEPGAPGGGAWTTYLCKNAGVDINVAASVWQHEERHRLDFVGIWGGNRVAANDTDHDYLLDNGEALMNPDTNFDGVLDAGDRGFGGGVPVGAIPPPNTPILGPPVLGAPRPYNPVPPAGYGTYADIWGYGENPLRDCEDYCMLWLLEWVNDFAKSQDWAHNGTQW